MQFFDNFFYRNIYFFKENIIRIIESNLNEKMFLLLCHRCIKKI